MSGQNFANGVPEIQDQDELERIIAGNGQEVKDDAPAGKAEDDDPDDDKNEPAGQKSKAPESKKEEKKSLFQEEKKEDGDEDEDEDEDDDKSDTTGKGKKGDEPEYSNMLEYLNEEHSLNLNLSALPKDMTREQEAEVISKIIGKMTQGVQQRLAQYKQIDAILQDEEVRRVIEAKSQGKSLREIASEYVQTTQGKNAEDLVRDDFKKKYPLMKDEVITKMIEGLKQSGEFDGTAEAIRTQAKNEEVLTAKQKEDLARKEAQEVEARRVAEVEEFGRKLGSVKDVFGIPLDDQMRAEILAASTEPDDEGLTYLDKALKTDEGVLLATLGVLHLQKLIQANASIKANKKNKTFMDKVFDSPERLQSGAGRKNEETTDYSVLNRW